MQTTFVVGRFVATLDYTPGANSYSRSVKDGRGDFVSIPNGMDYSENLSLRQQEAVILKGWGAPLGADGWPLLTGGPEMWKQQSLPVTTQWVRS